jgi:alpha-glucosidase
VLLLTLPGTPTLYYGDEIGQRDAEIGPDRVRDPIAALIPGRGRDPERAPMQWDGGPGAGFTTGEPWLPLAPDWPEVNVAAQRDDPDSMLTLHRRLLALRRRTPALTGIGYQPVRVDGEVLAYLRADEDERWLVALNLRSAEARLAVPGATGRVELSTVPGRDGTAVEEGMTLRPDEGVVVRLAD